MKRPAIIFFLFLFSAGNGFAQQNPLDTLGITKGSVHMKGRFPYEQFVKKHKGEDDLIIHVWYNPSGSSINKQEIKPGKDEIYFLYGRNQRTGLSEMDFKFGSNALEAFSKKKEKDLVELIDFLEFEVFAGQNFNGELAMEILMKALE